MTTSRNRPGRGRPLVTGVFEKRTCSIQYVVADPQTKRAAIIDPVLDFDPKSGSTAKASPWSGSSTRTRMPTISPRRAT